MSSIEIFKLFGSIFVDSDEAQASIGKTEKKAEGLGDKLKSGIKTAGKWGLAITGAAVAGAGALFGLAKKSAEATDRIDKMSQKLGMTRQGFQEWDYVLSQNGASIDSMNTATRKLNETMDNARGGSESAAEAFNQIGISLESLEGKSREEVFEMTIKGLQGVEDESRRAALGTELLGRSADELAPLLNAGADSIDNLKKQANDLGLVMGDDAIDAGVKFADTWDSVKRSFMAVATQVGVHVMPIIQDLLEWVLANMPQIQKTMQVVFDAIKVAVEVAVDVFKNYLLPAFMFVYDWVKENWPQIKEIIKVVIDTIVDIVKAFVEFFQAVWERWGDQITYVAEKVWDKIKIAIETSIKVIQGIIKAITSLIRGDWEGFWNGIRDVVSAIWDGIRNMIRVQVGMVRDIISGVFGKLGETMMKPFDWAYVKITEIIDKIKSAFSRLFPVNLKMPRFRLEGSLNPLNWIKNGGLPKVKIDWYKDGGIFKKPTLFDTPFGMKGVGDNPRSPEVVAPLHELRSMLDLDKPKAVTINMTVNVDEGNNLNVRELMEQMAFEAERAFSAKGGMNLAYD